MPKRRPVARRSDKKPIGAGSAVSHVVLNPPMVTGGRCPPPAPAPRAKPRKHR